MELEKKSNVEIIEAPSGHGGARPGSGRKLGSTQKLSGKDILEALENVLGIPYPTQLALNYQQALYGDDNHLKAKYDHLILNKVVADKIDITSGGNSIAPTILIDHKEIDE
jgi:hypothetical protein